MDFVSERLCDGRWIRVLSVVDQFTRECLLLLADSSLTGQKVALALSQVIAERHAPESITVDNRTEFASKAMDAWAYQCRVQLASSVHGDRWRMAIPNRSAAACATSV
jgi:putative transposase